MPKQWNAQDVEAAFTQALKAATGDQQLRRELLNEATAKNAFAKAGDIDVPDNVEVIFYKQEDLPLRMVMAMPAQKTGGPGEPSAPLPATFKDCFLCTYDTYETVDANAADNLKQILANLL